MVDIFVELITNAITAIGNKSGLLRIGTFRLSNNVLIQVTDNGPGIPQADLERLFEMFFTTDPQGLGFGLWWAKTFLEQQNGQISVESIPDEGTTFTITLPIPNSG